MNEKGNIQTGIIGLANWLAIPVGRDENMGYSTDRGIFASYGERKRYRL